MTMTVEHKAAVVRVACKDLRDHATTNPQERQVMRELIALEDVSLAILYNAFKRSDV